MRETKKKNICQMKTSVESVTNMGQGKGKIPELNDKVEKLEPSNKDRDTIRRCQQQFQMHMVHREG